MNIDTILAESEALADEIAAIFPAPAAEEEKRFVVSGVTCSLALEHWNAVKVLLSASLFPSAVVVHRAQFEAIVRSIWLLYAASEAELEKLAVGLSKETEQAAKNIAGLHEMISDIEKRGPTEAFNVIARFRDNALKPLNSYVHAGVHPLHRHACGYPPELMLGVLRTSNGVAVLSWIQLAMLARRPDLQRTIREISLSHPACMPSLLDQPHK